MRTTHGLIVAVLASATFASTVAIAGEAIYLTPPLFREQARATQQVRSVSDLTTTPQPVAATKPAVVSRAMQVVADAEAAANR